MRTDLLIAALVLLNVFGVLDWFLTRSELVYLGAVEANPLMRMYFEMGPFYALAVKLVTLGGVTLAIWMWRRYRAVLLVAVVALTAYFALIVYHVAGMATFA